MQRLRTPRQSDASTTDGSQRQMQLGLKLDF